MSDVPLSPGDILLFRGFNPKSLAIAALTNTPSQWLTDCAPSHVAVCADFRGRLMLWESTTLCDLPCEILGRKIRGVQAHSPSKRLESYRGRAWLMKPQEPLSHWQREKLADACLSHVGQEYGWQDLLRAGTIFGRIRTWVPSPRNPDCAHYVASVLRDACVLGKNIVPARMSPAYLARNLPYQEIYSRPVCLK